MQVTVKTLDSVDRVFPVEEDITVKQFKQLISGEVKIPADKQRLIYCGRVLQDDKKLSEYDVDQKVIHLVARAPPQSQNRSSSADSRAAPRTNRPTRQSGSSFLLRPNQNVVFGPVIVPQDSDNLTAGSSSSGVRLRQAQTMLEQASAALDVIQQRFNPELSSTANEASASGSSTSSASQTSTEMPQTTLARHPAAEIMTRIQNSEVDAIFSEIDSLHLMEPQMGAMMGPSLLGANPILAGGLAQAASAAVVSALSSLDGTQLAQSASTLGGLVTPRSTSSSNSAPPTTSSHSSSNQQASTSQSQSTPNGSATTDTQQSQRLTRDHPRSRVMATILEQYRSVQRRLDPYMERYYHTMANETTYSSASSPDLMVDQWLISKVSEVMHFMSHAMHGISDIIVDFRREPPRELRARPIIIPQPSLIQAQINVSTTEESPRSSTGTATSNTSTPSTARPQRSASASRVPSERRSRSSTASATSDPSTFNMRHILSADDGMVMMHVGSTDSGDSPNALQNLLSSITSEMTMHWGPEQTDAGTPASSTSQSSTGNSRGSSSPGQNTQAPGNSATSTTNSTHTRVTPVPHMQVTPFNVSGMALNQFDPFLHCSSHHLPSRRRHNASVQARQEAPRTATATRPPTSQTESAAATPPPATETRSVLQQLLSALQIGSDLQDLIQGPLYDVTAAPDEGSTLLARLYCLLMQSLQSSSVEHLQQEFSGHRLPGESIAAQIRRAVCELIPFLETFLLNPVDDMSNDTYSAPNTFFNFFNQRLTQLFNIMATHREPSQLVTRVFEYIVNMWKDFIALGLQCLNGGMEAIRSVVTTQMRESSYVMFPGLANSNIGSLLRIGLEQSLRDHTMFSERDISRYLVLLTDTEVPAMRREMNSQAASLIESRDVAAATEPQAMDVDETPSAPAEEQAREEPPLEINVGTQAWHSAVPEEWIPVITRDVARQRRSLPDTNPSDGYLCGMPLKRRRIASQHKPHGTVEEVLQSTLRTSLRTAGVAAPLLDRVSGCTSSDDLRESFAAQIRSSLSENLRDNKDFTPEKFPKSDQKIRKK